MVGNSNTNQSWNSPTLGFQELEQWDKSTTLEIKQDTLL